MATEVVKTVGTGGDYSTIAAFLTGETRDLVSADEIAVAECFSETFSGQVTFYAGSWVLDSTRRIVIRPASGHEHGGIRGAGPVFTSTGDATFYLYGIATITLIGLEIINTAAGLAARSIYCPNPSGALIVRECFCASESQTGSAATVDIRSSGITNLEFINNVVLGGAWGADLRLPSGSASIYNNTVHAGGNYGLLVAAGHIIKNNASLGTATADFFQGSASSNKNASEDGSAPGTNEQTIGSADFENIASDDYHPASGSALLSNGEDLSGTFTTDITGATRSNWSIGAYDALVGGAPATPFIPRTIIF